MTDWHPGIPLEYRDAIVTGDARLLAERIPDESVDLIFTDPPYHPEHMGLYGLIAGIGARVLKPGGFCVAYCGVAYMDEVMRQMEALTYFWTICGYQPESNLVFNAKNVGCHWRPILIYSNGKARAPRFIPDLWRTNRDKDHHEWGQGKSLPERYIDRLTEPGNIVYDPFTGGGTVPAVCKMLGRHYIASEIDPATAERARERVLMTQPPLFVPVHEQIGMMLGVT